MKNNIKIFGIFFLISFLGESSFAKKAQGVFTVVKGDVSILSEGKTKAVKARVGSKVHAKDIIEASKDSRAKIVMSDSNILNISPESKLELESYESGDDSKSKKVMLNLMYGKVRSSVKQKYDGERNVYRVKTPSAVAGVRGTDFIVDYNMKSKESNITTFEGVVQVASGVNASGRLINPVSVRPGQFTSAKPKFAPQAPANVPKEDLAKMDKGSNADLASTETAPGPKEKEGNRDPANKEKEPSGEKKESPSNEGGALPKKQDQDSQTSAPSDAKSPNSASAGAATERLPSSTQSGSMLPPPPPMSDMGGSMDHIIEPPKLSEFDQMQPVNPSVNNDINNQPRIPTSQIQDAIQNSGRVIIRPIQQ